MGIAGNLCVARRQRCPRIASSSRLELARNAYARDPLYFHHGLLGQVESLLHSAWMQFHKSSRTPMKIILCRDCGTPKYIAFISLAEDFQGVELALAEGVQHPLGMIFEEGQVH